FGMTEPHIGDPRAAGEPDAAVDDQRFAMRAVIELTDGVPANAVVPGELAPALLERLENLRSDRCRADRIEQDLDRNPLTGLGGERVGEAASDLARPVDVRLNRDRRLRATDLAQHDGIELVAVVQDVDAVAGEDRDT